MATAIWNALFSSGDWNTGANWTPSGVPAPTDDAFFGDAPGKNYTVNVTLPQVVGGIGIAPNTFTPTFSISGSLTAQGSIVYSTNLAVTFDINSGGSLTVGLGVASAGVPETMSIAGTGAGGTLRFANNLGSFDASAPGMTFAFANNGPTVSNAGVIEFDNVPSQASISKSIIDVAQGNEFVLPGNDYTGDTASLDTSTNLLTVTGSSGTVLTMLDVHLQSGAVNAFQIVNLDTIEAVPCYVPGTHLATPAGEAAVEDLQIGDLVLTASGAAKLVKWIGRRSYSAAAVAERPQLRPVLIRKGALVAGLPRRDLMVSPMHALYLDDAFVPASALVNGVSILRPHSERPVEYIHIELHDHDVLLAEGVQAESFVDDDSRAMFDNASEYYDLYGFAESQRSFSSPRLEEGYRLEAMRRRFAARAGIAPSAGVPGEMAGHVERLHDGELEGWVMDCANPTAPVELEVLVDGEIVATVLANRYRPDLDRAGLADGRCAFTTVMPPAAEDLSQVEVRRASDGGQVPMPQRARVTA